MKTPPDAAKLALTAFGEAVRDKRGNTTQKGLEASSGVPQSVISRIETGDYPNVTIGLVLRLCLGLECKPSDLLGHLDQTIVIARYEREAAA